MYNKKIHDCSSTAYSSSFSLLDPCSIVYALLLKDEGLSWRLLSTHTLVEKSEECVLRKLIICTSHIFDLFLTNNIFNITRIEVVPELSDHDILIIDSNLRPTRQKP